MDETMMMRDGSDSAWIHKCPSKPTDNKVSVVWIVGGIESHNSRRCFAERVKHRTIPVLLELCVRRLLPETVIVTDGHPVYRIVAQILNFTHHIVVHKQQRVKAYCPSPNGGGYHVNFRDEQLDESLPCTSSLSHNLTNHV